MCLIVFGYCEDFMKSNLFDNKTVFKQLRGGSTKPKQQGGCQQLSVWFGGRMLVLPFQNMPAGNNRIIGLICESWYLDLFIIIQH
jgi:hypothetical protein